MIQGTGGRSVNVSPRLRLPLRFNPAALQADEAAIEESRWQRHFNTGTYRGDWSGVTLRSNGGGSALYPDPHADGGVADTLLMAHCPAVRAALARFSCAISSVRFLRLAPGAEILEHRDYGLELETGEARLHVCVRTNDGVRFLLDGRPVAMADGECWYLDVSRPHSVVNRGTSVRTHLVIDCVLNDWLLAFLTTANDDTPDTET